MSDIQLAVCTEMVFTDLPVVERIRRIHDLGFAVEIWSWHDKDLDALAGTGARFSSMTGYLHGDLIDPASADEVVRTAELSLKAAETIGVPRLNLHTAELVDGQAARPRRLQLMREQTQTRTDFAESVRVCVCSPGWLTRCARRP